jgi:hypothetical protein
VGPTLIMMPEVLRELFRGGGRVEDYLTCAAWTHYRVAFAGGH